MFGPPQYPGTKVHESHTHQHSHTPQLLTEPVFAGDLAKSLAVGFPSSEEVDGAVLPALDHLHSSDRKARGSEVIVKIHHMQYMSHPPLC